MDHSAGEGASCQHHHTSYFLIRVLSHLILIATRTCLQIHLLLPPLKNQARLRVLSSSTAMSRWKWCTYNYQRSMGRWCWRSWRWWRWHWHCRSWRRRSWHRRSWRHRSWRRSLVGVGVVGDVVGVGVVGVGVVGVSVEDGIVSLEPNDSVPASRIRAGTQETIRSDVKKTFLIWWYFGLTLFNDAVIFSNRQDF